jgi:hypothetical protein
MVRNGKCRLCVFVVTKKSPDAKMRERADQPKRDPKARGAEVRRTSTGTTV